MAFDDSVKVGFHFPTSNCENEPEPCGDFNKSAGLSYVTIDSKDGSIYRRHSYSFGCN